jgi:cell wall-associated NlpC family hydrolase
MRRVLLILAALLVLLPAVPASAAKPRSQWASGDIQLVTERGLMGGDAIGFRADDIVTRGELAELLAGLTGAEPVPVSDPSAPLNLQELDGRLVNGLGLKDAAARFSRAARDAGLAPPSRFGAEVVARLLGLRLNHAAKDDVLERLPGDPAPRSEAAYSAAQVLRFGGWELDGVRAAAEEFAIPALTGWQRRILTTAFKLVGYPYIWGGTSDSAQAPFGVTVPGGYDCSGFVWRVFKLQAYPGGASLSTTLRGRTTFAMSGEIPKAGRIPLLGLQPADVIFFGDRGPSSKPAQVGHMGIYVGNGWFVHSSGRGVALERLAGWYQSRFAWARRPLVEARLPSGS